MTLRALKKARQEIALMHHQIEDMELEVRRVHTQVIKPAAAYVPTTRDMKEAVISLEAARYRELHKALLATKGNKMRAAKLLGINVKTVYSMLQRSRGIRARNE